MSSRIIVKNLPKYVTEDRVKKHFGEKSNVTDIRLMKSEDGTFRRFAFLGFVSNDEATAAVNYFHGTFFDTCKLHVELAKSLGDKSLPRSWSKYSKTNIVAAQPLPVVKKPQELESKEKDAKLSEFLDVMKPKKGEKTWTNDDAFVENEGNDENEDSKGDKKAALSHVMDDKMSDMEYLKSRMVAENDGDHDNEENGNYVKTPSIRTDDTILDTGRLFVRNLGYDITEDELMPLFSKFGQVAELHISIDKMTKKSKGFAYVLFMFPENALKAFQSLDGTIFRGRLLHIIPAQEKRELLRRSVEEEENEASSTNYRKKKDRALKGSAGQDFNWNTLFINSNAVVSAMSQKLDIDKSELLDHNADNLAVRVALAETHIIADTKEYLQKNGISLDFIQDCGAEANFERSKTIILVKNIPFEVSDLEIRNLFQKFGSLGRVLVPPSKGIAIVEFLEAVEAKSAFKNLAYTRLKTLPMFLEWAPERLFSQTFNDYSKQKTLKLSDKTLPNDESLLIADEESSSSTVYVKNLNFTTTVETLQSLLQETVGSVRSITIAKKKDTNGDMKSLGYGFVEFTGKEAAIRAISKLQGYELEGHCLQLKLSSPTIKTQKIVNASSNVADRVSLKRAPNSHCTKLMIKNIPFEASDKEVKELFRSFGQIKTVRLPKKMSGHHRGFGFVDFLTHEDAATCMKTLLHTHFYGRHLVLDWAQDDESVDALREKAIRREKSMKQAKITRSKVESFMDTKLDEE